MGRLCDLLDVEVFDAAKLSRPFYLWPLSDTTMNIADGLGLMNSHYLKGFIDSAPRTVKHGSTRFSSRQPSPDIVEPVFITTSHYRDEIFQDLVAKTNACECYFIKDATYLTRVVNPGKDGERRSFAVYEARRGRLLRSLERRSAGKTWPWICPDLVKALREGYFALTDDQIDRLEQFNLTADFDVAYVSAPAHSNFVRQSSYLRSRNWKTVLLTINEFYGQDKTRFFDEVVHTGDNYFLLLAYALLTPANFLHVRCWMPGLGFGALISALSGQKTVFEFMDIPEKFTDRRNYGYLYGEDLAREDFEGLPAVFTNADGLILNHTEKEMKALKKKHERENHVIQFHEYVYDAFCTERGVQLSKPFSIVYAGSFSPSSDPHPFFGTTQLLRLIQRLTGQGIRFFVYFNPFTNVKLMWDYQFEAKRNPRFELKRGKAPYLVSRDLSSMHFGSLLFDLEGVEVKKGHYGSLLPTKVTLYLEAGLPILVSEELDYVAEIVTSNQIGLVIAKEDIDDLDRILESCDYATLRGNVLDFRKGFNYVEKGPLLVEFYGSL
jgi:hypothetical protein